MNLNRALEHAHAIAGSKPGKDGSPPKGAARLYADIEYELAMGDPTPAQEQAGESALAVLEEHFHGIKQASDAVVVNGHIPRMSRKAKAQVFSDEPEGGGGTATATRPTSSPTPAPPPAVPKPARQRVQRARASRSVPRNITKTVSVVNQATGGWGDDAWIFILGGFGLSFLFLVLTKPKGLQNLMTGASQVLRWVIDPTIDPLRPTTTGAK